MEDNTRTGLPLLRPLFLEFPDAVPDRHPLDIDLKTSGEFMVGPDLLVAAPPFPEKTDDYEAKLPGPGWYDFWTGKRIVPAKARSGAADFLPIEPELPTVHIRPELATLPVFVRPGTILPIAPVVQSTLERPEGPLTLRVFPGPQCAGSLYQDDGTSFDYRQGDFLRIRFSCELSAIDGALQVHIGRHEGRFEPWWKQIEVEISDSHRQPASATVNGRPVAYRLGDRGLILRVDDDGEGMDIVLR
jgi:alpha-glucosidase